MAQARRFHSNFLFIIPLTQGVLLVIILDFCKNAVFFANQANNLAPTSFMPTDNGQAVERPKDAIYLLAQYIYAIWLIAMMLKAIIGLRANLKFNIHWMAKYNVLLGIDTGFEFIHTTLGIIFEDLSQMDDAAVIRHYCVSYFVWVRVEMPHLLAPDMRRQSFWELMFPCITSRSHSEARVDMAQVAVTTPTAGGSDVGVEVESSSRPQSPSLTTGSEFERIPQQAGTPEAARNSDSNHIQVVVQR
ncbi:hypothetical protein BGZ65_011802 [Modicella reniformis]|uniref:Uncharacterized protein n=1 Tax=Modicella reniformis TaxID=1440133 RepID=A0A9P6J3E5_9FUNG|nr:hypothetical protein BGZ65_011802 [Modicella reniformis]